MNKKKSSMKAIMREKSNTKTTIEAQQLPKISSVEVWK
jgi:hypothetical protein